MPQPSQGAAVTIQGPWGPVVCRYRHTLSHPYYLQGLPMMIALLILEDPFSVFLMPWKSFPEMDASQNPELIKSPSFY